MKRDSESVREYEQQAEFKEGRHRERARGRERERGRERKTGRCRETEWKCKATWCWSCQHIHVVKLARPLRPLIPNRPKPWKELPALRRK